MPIRAPLQMVGSFFCVQVISKQKRITDEGPDVTPGDALFLMRAILSFSRRMHRSNVGTSSRQTRKYRKCTLAASCWAPSRVRRRTWTRSWSAKFRRNFSEGVFLIILGESNPFCRSKNKQHLSVVNYFRFGNPAKPGGCNGNLGYIYH